MTDTSNNVSYEAYKMWLTDNVNAANQDKINVFRLYDNYKMSEAEAIKHVEDIDAAHNLPLFENESDKVFSKLKQK